jgi:hypothetical protein
VLCNLTRLFLYSRAVSSTAAFDLYLGQLFPIEDYRTFGAYSNTHNKTIVICENATSDTGGIKETIASLNSAFVNAIQNPFQPVGTPLVSKALDISITQIVQRHNANAAKRKV